MKNPGWGWFKYNKVYAEDRKHWVGRSSAIKLLLSTIVGILALLAFYSYKTGQPLF